MANNFRITINAHKSTKSQAECIADFTVFLVLYVELHEERRDLNVLGFLRFYAGFRCRAKKQYLETDL